MSEKSMKGIRFSLYLQINKEKNKGKGGKEGRKWEGEKEKGVRRKIKRKRIVENLEKRKQKQGRDRKEMNS